jgi:hypothetical protein
MRPDKHSDDTPIRDLFEFRNIWLFLLGTICLAIIGEGSFNLLEGVLREGWGFLVGDEGRTHVLAATIAIVVLVFLVFAIQVRLRVLQRLHMQTVKPEVMPISPHPGVILLVSVRRDSAEQAIITHHLQELRCCWLITSQEAQAQGEKLAVSLEQRDIDARRVHLADVHSIEPAYDAVRYAIQDARQIPKIGDQVVVDITGATKLASVGAVLACLDEGVTVEYVAIQRDTNGKELLGTEKVLQITFPAQGRRAVSSQ